MLGTLQRSLRDGTVEFHRFLTRSDMAGIIEQAWEWENTWGGNQEVGDIWNQIWSREGSLRHECFLSYQTVDWSTQ